MPRLIFAVVLAAYLIFPSPAAAMDLDEYARYVICTKRSFWPWCLKCTKPIKVWDFDGSQADAKEVCHGSYEIFKN